MKTDELGNGHLNEDQVAGYLDRSLSAGQRELVEGHLADCPECREEIKIAAGLIRSGRQLKIWYWGSSIAAAAAVILLVAGPFLRSEPGAPTLRGISGPDAGVRAISAVAPQSGASVNRENLKFVWASIEPDINYRFTLTDLLGEEIWQADIADTAVVLPSDITLVPGESYVWLVDALLLDGRSVTTGSQSFVLNR